MDGGLFLYPNGIVQSAKGTSNGLTHLPKRFPVLGKLLPHTGKTPYNKEKTDLRDR